MNLTINDFSIFQNSLNNFKVDIFLIFDTLLFIFFNGHVKGNLFLQEMLLDEDSWHRKRFRVVVILSQFVHDFKFQQFVLVEDIKFSLFLIQVVIIVAFTTKSHLAFAAESIEEAGSGNGEESMAIVANKGSFECTEGTQTAFVL